jgi:DNA invertase Pin-like site-specific DNA recombinase
VKENKQMDDKPKEVISLVRLSTAEQVGEFKAGLDRQIATNIDTANRFGLKIRRTITAIDVSGRHVRLHPEFQQLFEELKDSGLRGIVISEQSRLIRPDNFSDVAIFDEFSLNGKVIFLPTEMIDPSTPSGWINCLINAMMSGQELKQIKSRTNGSKERLRMQGLHVENHCALPRTVKYIRIRNENGKVIKTRWELNPLEVQRTLRAAQLLREGLSYSAICRKVGNWTKSALRKHLMNPIHIGIRRYSVQYTGPEYLPEPTAKNPTPTKMRRKMRKREIILDVPTREELEAGTKPPIVEPIMTLAQWDELQEIITQRKTNWTKWFETKPKRPAFLVAGLTFCRCGMRLYGQRHGYNTELDNYRCASMYDTRKRCPQATSIHRADLESAIGSMMKQLVNPKFVQKAVESILEARQAQGLDKAAHERELAREKLEFAKRELRKALRSGDLDAASFKEDMTAVENDLRALNALAPKTGPIINPEEVAKALYRAFLHFSDLPFESKRKILTGAIKEIIVDAKLRQIIAITIRNGYLGSQGIVLTDGLVSSVNSCSHRTAQTRIYSSPDLTLPFGESLIIPRLYSGRSASDEAHVL